MNQECAQCHGPLEKVRVAGTPNLWKCLKCQKANQKVLQLKRRNSGKVYEDKTITK